jgi:hypothetical protein
MEVASWLAAWIWGFSSLPSAPVITPKSFVVAALEAFAFDFWDELHGHP